MRQALGKLFTYIGKGLSEDNGNPSNLRLTIFITYLTLIPCIALGFLWVVFKWENQIILYLTAVLGFLGSLIGMKVWQKGKEENAKS